MIMDDDLFHQPEYDKDVTHAIYGHLKERGFDIWLQDCGQIRRINLVKETEKAADTYRRYIWLGHVEVMGHIVQLVGDVNLNPVKRVNLNDPDSLDQIVQWVAVLNERVSDGCSN
jgi:hypothetical protein